MQAVPVAVKSENQTKQTGVAAMKVSEILQVKGNILYTASPDMLIVDAVNTMAEKDIGSLVVMEYGDLLGVLSFYDVARAVLEAQSFENRMLKAYIRDWPAEADQE